MAHNGYEPTHMHTDGVIITLLVTLVFLLFSSVLQVASKRYSVLPYTVALLLAGFFMQWLNKALSLGLHLEISHSLIYHLLLPLLLFESGMHINIHQFKLQFKTITFMATFGLMVSVGVVATVLVYALGVGWGEALLFGSIISATDPIAVITLFKTLGAPKRLGLLADGESMLNDATGVIMYRIMAILIVGAEGADKPTVFSSIGNFLYVFLGSMLFGAVAGYLFSRIIEKVKSDRLIEMTLTVVLAIGTFVLSELLFELSGVITTVIAAIIMGNLGQTKISHDVHEFIHEAWEYFAFLAVSLVFFFATYNLDIGIFHNRITEALTAIVAVLIGRAVSVYLSSYISNRSGFFADEPNIPTNWQHILNWGGLRGVIPLVLVYSIPESYPHRDLMLVFTMSAFLFTLLINGLTIRPVLLGLKLHIPSSQDRLRQLIHNIFTLETEKETLENPAFAEFDAQTIRAMKDTRTQSQTEMYKDLCAVDDIDLFRRSLQIEVLNLERQALQRLYALDRISQDAYYNFDAELDMQQDALEYPDLFEGVNSYRHKGKVRSRRSFRQSLYQLRRLASSLPLLKPFTRKSEDDLISNRIGVLTARVVTSETVFDFLRHMEQIVSKNKTLRTVITEEEVHHKKLIKKNQFELSELAKKYKKIYTAYQEGHAANLIQTLSLSHS